MRDLARRDGVGGDGGDGMECAGGGRDGADCDSRAEMQRAGGTSGVVWGWECGGADWGGVTRQMHIVRSNEPAARDTFDYAAARAYLQQKHAALRAKHLALCQQAQADAHAIIEMIARRYALQQIIQLDALENIERRNVPAGVCGCTDARRTRRCDVSGDSHQTVRLRMGSRIQIALLIC